MMLAAPPAAAANTIAREWAALESVHVAAGGAALVSDVTVRLERAELVCVLGPNGAGKSTLLSLLNATRRPRAGTVRLFGIEVWRRPERERARVRVDIGTVFQRNDYNAHVPLTVRVYRNPIVFRDGDTIAETRIDGTRGDDQVAKDVAEFVRQSVVERAVRERMIPARGREDAFGRVDILETVQRIRDANRLVRLRAVADGDIRAADPLKIRFVIR
jgi:ABC-type Fe3+/spermidine/putrescine transport system ATPase subunit